MNSTWKLASCFITHYNVMSFKQDGVISTLNRKPLNLVDQFSFLNSNISSTESNVNICIEKTWTTIDWLSIIWKSDFSVKIKQDFIEDVVISVLLYGCTTWTLIKC